MQKDYSVQQHSRVFWLCGALFQHPQPPRNESHLSALLCLTPFPMLDKHTLHCAHLQSNKETTVWICAFSLCMSPTLQMVVSICNKNVTSFCEECVLWWVFGFHLSVTHTYINPYVCLVCIVFHVFAVSEVAPALGWSLIQGGPPCPSVDKKSMYVIHSLIPSPDRSWLCKAQATWVT